MVMAEHCAQGGRNMGNLLERKSSDFGKPMYVFDY
jgi:hypothetical protein